MQDVRTRHHNYGNRQRNAHWLGCAAGQNAAVRSPLCTSVRAIRVASARDAQLAALIANLGSRSTKFSIGHSIIDARSLQSVRTCPRSRKTVLPFPISLLSLFSLLFFFFNSRTCRYYLSHTLLVFFSSGHIFLGNAICITWKKIWTQDSRDNCV